MLIEIHNYKKLQYYYLIILTFNIFSLKLLKNEFKFVSLKKNYFNTSLNISVFNRNFRKLKYLI